MLRILFSAGTLENQAREIFAKYYQQRLVDRQPRFVFQKEGVTGTAEERKGQCGIELVDKLQTNENSWPKGRRRKYQIFIAIALIVLVPTALVAVAPITAFSLFAIGMSASLFFGVSIGFGVVAAIALFALIGLTIFYVAKQISYSNNKAAITEYTEHVLNDIVDDAVNDSKLSLQEGKEAKKELQGLLRIPNTITLETFCELSKLPSEPNALSSAFDKFIKERKKDIGTLEGSLAALNSLDDDLVRLIEPDSNKEFNILIAAKADAFKPLIGVTNLKRLIDRKADVYVEAKINKAKGEIIAKLPELISLTIITKFSDDKEHIIFTARTKTYHAHTTAVSEFDRALYEFIQDIKNNGLTEDAIAKLGIFKSKSEIKNFLKFYATLSPNEQKNTERILVNKLISLFIDPSIMTIHQEQENKPADQNQDKKSGSSQRLMQVEYTNIPPIGTTTTVPPAPSDVAADATRTDEKARVASAVLAPPKPPPKPATSPKDNDMPGLRPVEKVPKPEASKEASSAVVRTSVFAGTAKDRMDKAQTRRHSVPSHSPPPTPAKRESLSALSASAIPVRIPEELVFAVSHPDADSSSALPESSSVGPASSVLGTSASDTATNVVAVSSSAESAELRNPFEDGSDDKLPQTLDEFNPFAASEASDISQEKGEAPDKATVPEQSLTDEGAHQETEQLSAVVTKSTANLAADESNPHDDASASNAVREPIALQSPFQPPVGPEVKEKSVNQAILEVIPTQAPRVAILESAQYNPGNAMMDAIITGKGMIDRESLDFLLNAAETLQVDVKTILRDFAELALEDNPSDQLIQRTASAVNKARLVLKASKRAPSNVDNKALLDLLNQLLKMPKVPPAIRDELTPIIANASSEIAASAQQDKLPELMNRARTLFTALSRRTQGPTRSNQEFINGLLAQAKEVNDALMRLQDVGEGMADPSVVENLRIKLESLEKEHGKIPAEPLSTILPVQETATAAPAASVYIDERLAIIEAGRRKSTPSEQEFTSSMISTNKLLRDLLAEVGIGGSNLNHLTAIIRALDRVLQLQNIDAGMLSSITDIVKTLQKAITDLPKLSAQATNAVAAIFERFKSIDALAKGQVQGSTDGTSDVVTKKAVADLSATVNKFEAETKMALPSQRIQKDTYRSRASMFVEKPAVVPENKDDKVLQPDQATVHSTSVKYD